MNLRRVPWFLVVLLLVVAVHAGGVRRAPLDPELGFVYDDEAVILMNRERLTDPSTALAAWWRPELFNGAKGNAMYRPVAHGSHVLDAALSGWGEKGPPVRGWRLTNLLLHGLSAALLYLLLRRVLDGFGLGAPFGPRRPSGAETAALLGALWFGFQPVNGEVVHYVTARSESLASLFFLLALLLHQAAWDGARSTRSRRILVLLAALAAFLSFGSKETGILLPVVAAALEIWGRPDGGSPAERARRASLRILPLAAAGLLYLLARKAAMPPSRFEVPAAGGRGLGAPRGGAHAPPAPPRAAPGGGGPFVRLVAAAAALGALLLSAGGDAGVDSLVGGGRSLPAHLLTQARVAAASALLVLFPVDLAPDHGVRVATALDGPTLAALLLLLLGGFLVVRSALRGGRALPLAAAWAAAAAAPSFLVPLNVVMNEHRLYLPLTGAALAVGLLGLAVLRRAAAAAAAAAGGAGGALLAVACAFILVDGDRAWAWSDANLLWEQAVATSPASWRAHMHLGVQSYRAAEKSHADAGRATDRVGRTFGTRAGNDAMDFALEEFTKAHHLYPRSFETRLNLGFLHLFRGRVANRDVAPGEPVAAPEEFREAIRWFTLAEESSPGSFRALFNRASAMAEGGMTAEAIPEFERLSADTSRTTLYAWPLADAYRRAGRFDDALLQLRHIEEVDPAQAGAAALRAGEVLVDGKRFADAKRELERAARILGPEDPRPPLHMARLLVATGLPENLPMARMLWKAALERGHRPGPKDRAVESALKE